MNVYNPGTKPSDFLTNLRDLDFALYLLECGLDPVLRKYGVHTIHIIILTPFCYE